MRVFYCDHFELPLPESHRFPVAKYAMLRRSVASRLGECIVLDVAPAATWEELALVHTSEYLGKLQSGSLSELEQKRIGFPWSKKMLHRCRRSVGATIAAASRAIDEGVSVHLSGGTHHAFANDGQGYCVFNDVAVAIECLLGRKRIQRALVVDLDVHQGNGTAAIFARRSDVTTLSMHGDRNYPFRKMHSDVDIGLPDGTEGTEYLTQLRNVLATDLLDGCDIVFYIAGADPYDGDRIGKLRLSKADLLQRDREVFFSVCFQRAIPVAVVMGGGYADERDVAEIHTNTVVCAWEAWRAMGEYRDRRLTGVRHG